MKLFAISDIHGHTKALLKAAHLIEESNVVIISGDITRHGTLREARDILNHIEKYNKNILAVHGNIDKPEVIDFLEEKNYSIHAKCRVVDGIAFFGVGGSSPTPMKTATEYSEDRIMEFLENGYKKINGHTRKVLVSHTPPRGIRDRTFFGLRGGSRSIKRFIKTNPVDLCLVGHIHEASGVSLYNNSIVANSGSFRRGRYLSVKIGENINVNKQRV